MFKSPTVPGKLYGIRLSPAEAARLDKVRDTMKDRARTALHGVTESGWIKIVFVHGLETLEKEYGIDPPPPPKPTRKPRK